MEKIDRVILGGFQKFSDFSQIEWGKNCYWWALLLTHLCGVWSMFNAYYAYTKLRYSEGPEDLLLVALIFSSIMISVSKFLQLPNLKKMSKSDTPQTDPMFGFAGSDHRLLWLIVGALALLLARDPILGIAVVWAGIDYFLTCTPRPPRPSALPQAS